MSSHNYPHFCIQMKRWIHCIVTAECYLIDHFNQRAVVWLNDNCYLQQTISAADDNNKMSRANEMSGGSALIRLPIQTLDSNAALMT